MTIPGEEMEALSMSQGERGGSGSGSAKRILVVDDNPDSAESLALMLGFWKYEVRIAIDGPAAVDQALEFLPHVVLLDVGLPGMSGYDVARRLRSEPLTRAALLIALTGYGQPEDRDRSAEAGFDHHLTKPVAPDVLRSFLPVE